MSLSLKGHFTLQFQILQARFKDHYVKITDEISAVLQIE